MKRYIMILAAGLVAGAALADTIITPISVVLTDNGNDNVIETAGGDAWFDGSGLSDATIVENGDTVPAVLPTHQYGENFSRMARIRYSTDGLAELTFDLGGTYEVGGMILWNYGNIGSTVRGVENAAISWSSDGINFFSAETLSFAETPNVIAQIVGQEQTLGTSLPGVTHIRMALDNFDATKSIVAFSEIRMVAVPEPATLGLLGAFGGAILFIRRRLMI
ncbi:PEP-CTERM sorting domain-containing protein [Pontiella sulfatireligans]|uniref:Ice-binding protein C-terminal domain-containing protein n=1 Tax=Pontiella sulfatireligans TaxID=2750658 RepID=A0A6C2USD8_9BACT|nr:PEP-CTERM sorting domain-containing protein [Pontiella sulfatireligans]VGO23250.1 hypothetical protein SCARR_05357 [Pontiella sulfatireligans]